MIEAIITTYLLTVNGLTYLPASSGPDCICSTGARSIACTIGNVVTGHGILKIVSTTGPNGEPVEAKVTVECRQ